MTKCIDCSAMGGTAQDCLCQILANVEKKLLNRERRRALVLKENARRRIIVPTDDQLARCSVHNRTGMVVRNTQLARRPFVEFTADMVYGFADQAAAMASELRDEAILRGDVGNLSERVGGFFWADGSAYKIPDIDEVFGEPSFKWVSDLKKFALRECRQRPQKRILERLRFIYLAIEVWNPIIARHILR
jgi:hypothetical protein